MLTVLVWLCLLPGSQAQYTASAYPDNSPALEDFRLMGIERTDTIWTAEDYQTAFQLLDEIYGVDKMSLPRHGSEYSGPLYDRLLSYENFAFLDDSEQDLGRRLIAYERGKDIPARLLLYYRESNQPEEGFDLEVLDALLLAFYVESQGIELYEELLTTLPPAAANTPRLIAAMERTQLRYSRALDRIMAVFLNDLNRYSKSALSHFVGEVFFLLPPRLTDSARPEVSEQISEALLSIEQEELRTVLLELRAQL